MIEFHQLPGIYLNILNYNNPKFPLSKLADSCLLLESPPYVSKNPQVCWLELRRPSSLDKSTTAIMKVDSYRSQSQSAVMTIVAEVHLNLVDLEYYHSQSKKKYIFSGINLVKMGEEMGE